MQMSLVCVMMNTSHIKALSNKERSRHHERKRRIAKDVSCILERANEQTGNTYKYVDAFGNTKYVYAWRLTPTDPTPKENGKALTS